MTKVSQSIRDCIFAACLVGGAFVGGWCAFVYSFASSRRVAFDSSRPHFIPHGCEAVVCTPAADTASISVGDRVDIFVEVDGKCEPLILDAVVTRQTKTSFGMLARYGGRNLLAYAKRNDWRLVIRPSIAFTDPIVIKSYDGK